MKLKDGIFTIITALATAAPVYAGTVTINFKDSGLFNGGPIGSPSSPVGAIWGTATFVDTGLNQVTLTMSVDTSLGGTQQYVNEWYFNVSGTPLLAFLNTGLPAATGNPMGVEYGSDCCALGPSPKFDLRFNFNTSNPGNLAQGLTSIYQITGTGLTASSFNTLNQGFLAAVKVQADGASFDVKGVLDERIVSEGTTPEPASLALLGLALIGAAAARRRR